MNRLAAGFMAVAVAGVTGAQAPPQSTRVAFEAASIRPVARTGTDTFGAGLGLPVVDHTNLEGYFDFELDLSGFMPGAGEQRSPAISSAAMETAYREQLGLRLERRNEPTSILVIDHLEQPTPD